MLVRLDDSPQCEHLAGMIKRIVLSVATFFTLTLTACGIEPQADDEQVTRFMCPDAGPAEAPTGIGTSPSTNGGIIVQGR